MIAKLRIAKIPDSGGHGQLMVPGQRLERQRGIFRHE